MTTGQTSTYLVMDVIPKLTWGGGIELAADIHTVEHGCGACLRFKNYKQQTTPRDTHATYSCNGCKVGLISFYQKSTNSFDDITFHPLGV